MPGPGGGFHVDVRWLGSMDQPSDGGKPLPFKNQKADQAVKYYAKRLFDIHGDKLPGSDAGKFIKEAVAYRRPLDGDDAEEGAAVALDDVVSEPSSLTLRPRIPEKDAVLMVAYARVDEGEVSLQVLHEMPVTACDALSCLDIAKQFAPDDTPREDLDFFVAAGYSDQDVKLVKTTLADDYLADRFVRVEASASVSEVVEPRRGRRHAHVLLFEQPCVHTLDDDDPSLTTVQLSDRVRDAVPTSGPAGHHCLEVKLPGRMLPHTLIEVTVRDLSGTSVVDANPTMATRTADALDKSALELLEIWLNLSEESERNGPAEPSLAVELLRRLMNPGLSGALLPQLAITVATDGGAPAVVGDAAAPIKVADDSQVSRRFHFVLTCDVNAVRHDGAGARRCLLMVCVGPRGSVATKFFDVDDALLATSQVDLALRTLEEAAGGATTLRPEDVLKNSVFRVSDKFADEQRDAAARRTLATQLTELKGPCIAGSKLTFSSGSLRDAMRGFPERSSFLICNAACFAHARPGSTKPRGVSALPVCDVRLTVVMRSLGRRDAPASEAEAYWLRPELPPLVDACWAAVATGTVTAESERALKRLQVVARSFGNDYLKKQLAWLDMSKALGTFPQPASVTALEYFGTSIEALTLTDASSLESSRFRDTLAESYPRARDELAAFDALKILQLKRICQWMGSHAHLAVAYLLFTYWLLEGGGKLIQMFGLTMKLQESVVQDDEELANCLSHTILCEHDFRDYDEGSGADARRALEDLAFLWVAKAPKAVPHLDAAAAAGNAFAAAVLARLRAGHPSKKLARKYDLTTFGVKFLELLPPGLQGLEQAISKYPKDIDAERAEASASFDVPAQGAGGGHAAKKKKPKKTKKKKAKAKEAMSSAREDIEETSRRDAAPVAARGADGVAALKPLSRVDQRRVAERLADPGGLLFGTLSRNGWILADLKNGKTGNLLQEKLWRPSVDAALVAALDGRRLSNHCYRALRDLDPERQALCALALESADLSTIKDVSGYIEKGLEKGTLLRKGHELVAARPREAPPSPPRRAAPPPPPPAASAPPARPRRASEPAPAAPPPVEARLEPAVRRTASAFDAPVSKAEVQRRAKAFADAEGLDDGCRAALERYAARHADGCVRFLRAAPGEIGNVPVDERSSWVSQHAAKSTFLLAASASQLEALAPELRRVADALALTSDVAKALKKLSLDQQRRAAERLADPGGVLFGVLNRNGRILIDLKKREMADLLRDNLGRPSVDAALVAALDGRRLSKDCYRALRDLDPERQALCAAALESADLSTIKDPASAWGPPPSVAASGVAASPWDWPAAGAAAPPPPAFDGAYDDDDDFVVPEGLVDVERRSNCSLDAIVAVLHRCATFRREFSSPRSPSGVIGVTPGAARDDHVRVLDALEVALTTVDDHHDEALDAAIDGLRRALRGLRAKATTTPATRTSRGDGVHDRRRARRGASLESAFRDAHAACSKSCDHCKAPGSVDVVIDIGQVPRALALSVAWFTSTPEPADVEGVLRLAHAPLDGAGIFREPKPGAKPARRLGLFAVVVFQDAHYTALVRDKRADAWTWYDRRDVTLVGSFESVVAKCRNDGGAPLCPYLLFYDAPA
ncbi:hypothetical protein JL720_6310 [Aureococcus anophagefferens]|nr:hypothetical protein JL720_6310 [Aureococcus anophagefferens]